MITIHKYQLCKLGEAIPVSMPLGALVLDAQVQHGQYVVWAEVDTEAAIDPRIFAVMPTGYSIDGLPPRRHISTVQSGDIVAHIFELFASA